MSDSDMFMTKIINVVQLVAKQVQQCPVRHQVVRRNRGLTLAAIAGPVIMLVGLFANWWGNIFKLVRAIANLFLKFRPLTTEQAATAGNCQAGCPEL
jgi:hypothetical protein